MGYVLFLGFNTYIYIYIYSTPFNDAPDDLLERIEREHEKA
jgi:hypothetical protein